MESVMLGMVLRPGYPARGLERWRVGAGSARLPGRPAEPSDGLRLPTVGIGIPPRDAPRAGPKPRPCHLGVPSDSILHTVPRWAILPASGRSRHGVPHVAALWQPVGVRRRAPCSASDRSEWSRPSLAGGQLSLI